MSSKSLLRGLMLVLLTATSARAQSLGNDCSAAPCGTSVHPIDQAIDGVTHFFDSEWPHLWEAPRCPAKYKIWGSTEYMLVWLKHLDPPPLVTTGPAGSTAPLAAVLGQPGTSVVAGGNQFNANPFSAMRFTVGSWLSTLDDRGVEVSGFFLASRSTSFTAGGNGGANSIAVGRPFFETTTGQETIAYSALANQLAGTSAAALSTNLWGVEVNGLARERLAGAFNVTFLGGVRYLSFDQNLTAQDNSSPLGTASIPFAGLFLITPGNGVRVSDTFQTRNDFIGGQLGLRTSLEAGRFEFMTGAKLALGSTRQTLNIIGQTEALTSGGQVVATTPGGLLANQANMGRYNHNTFSVVPEVEFKVSLRLTDWLSGFVSYDLLYWTQMAMAGNQVPHNVSASNIPTFVPPYVANPGAVGSASIAQTNFLMNSVTFGAVLKY